MLDAGLRLIDEAFDGAGLFGHSDGCSGAFPYDVVHKFLDAAANLAGIQSRAFGNGVPMASLDVPGPPFLACDLLSEVLIDLAISATAGPLTRRRVGPALWRATGATNSSWRGRRCLRREC